MTEIDVFGDVTCESVLWDGSRFYWVDITRPRVYARDWPDGKWGGRSPAACSSWTRTPAGSPLHVSPVDRVPFEGVNRASLPAVAGGDGVV
ncbi:hypothetical protein [Acrocarpospora sp. B8E8]|uniref:hypothetical protein n=1 Tax=Acrocarpospora sp. B8E8 TaxID=3153572 RepID=UPI00325F7B1F